MTREEILNMPAGKEIDWLIAHKLMGFVAGRKTTAYLDGSGEWTTTHIPHFSTNIEDAWEVFECLSKSSVETALSRSVEHISIGHDYEGWSCSVWWFKDIPSSHAVEGIPADTAPLAICRAALLCDLLAAQGVE